jgi:predicted ABC-type sugar transport system permease subunit
MSLDLAIGAWPLTALAVAAAIWGTVSLVKVRKLTSWQSMTVLGLLIFPAIVVPLYAVHFWADPNIHTPETQEAPLNFLNAAWALFTIVLVGCIGMARGFRLALAGVASLVVWFSAGMCLVSVMAVSGVWL